MKRQNALKKSRMNPSYCSFSVRENLLCRELAELPLRTLRHGKCLTEQILSPSPRFRTPTMLSSGSVASPSAFRWYLTSIVAHPKVYASLRMSSLKVCVVMHAQNPSQNELSSRRAMSGWWLPRLNVTSFLIHFMAICSSRFSLYVQYKYVQYNRFCLSFQ